MSKKPLQTQDKYVLRLPDGLRDRIKTYADLKGRSMNAQIVLILEREFPEPWSLTDRIDRLMELTASLQKGASSDEMVDKLVNTIEETVKGILSGRINDVDEEVRTKIQDRYYEYLNDVNEANLQFDYDEEEIDQLERDGTTKKFVDPDFPE